MTDDPDEEGQPEDFNDALEALASASMSGPSPDTHATRRTGQRPHASSRVTMDEDRRLGGRVWCRRCENSLVGRTLEGHCEKCSAPVAASVDCRQLGFAPRDWLAGLYRGVSMMAIGTLAIIILAGFGIGVLNFLETDPSLLGLDAGTIRMLIMARDVLLSVGVSLIYGLAVWWITRPRPDRLDDTFPHGLARVTRWLAVPVIVVEGVLGVAIAIVGGDEVLTAFLWVVRVPVQMIYLAAWVLVMVYLMCLARRIPDKNLARATLHVTVGLPGTFIVGFAVLLFFTLVLGLAGDIESAARGLALGSCMLLLAVFALAAWYIATLFRYRRAFAHLAGVALPSTRRR